MTIASNAIIGTRMTRSAMISITLLALIALLLIMLLGRHGVAGTVDEGESKVQTNEPKNGS